MQIFNILTQLNSSLKFQNFISCNRGSLDVKVKYYDIAIGHKILC